jgi:hypothetical protein
MKRLLLAAFLSVCAAPAFAACPSPITVKDASGTTQNMTTVLDASSNCESVSAIVDGAGTNKMTVKAASTAPAATDLAAVVGISPNSPMVGTAGSAGASVITVQGIASMTPLLANPGTIATWGLMSGTTPGAAPTNTNIMGGIYNSSAPAPTTGQTLPLQQDSSGNLKAAITAGANIMAVKAASTAALATDPSAVFQISPNDPVIGITTGAAACTSGSTANQCLKQIDADVKGPLPAGTNTIGNVIDYFSTNNANAQPHICGNHVFKHITTATDTQIVAASGSQTIYVCDYSISFNGTGNIYLEKATSGTCATLTQIDQAWYGVVNAGKTNAKPFYTGLNTGASAQLCANTSAAVTIDIAVDYDQY